MSDELECKLPLGADRDLFLKADMETKLNYLYDLNCLTIENQLNLTTYMKKKKKIDTTLASAMGFIAGAVSAFLEKMVRL